MDEFVYALIAGLVIFALAFFIATPGIAKEREEIEKELVLFSEDMGNIGSLARTFTDIPIGDMSVGFTKGEKEILSIDRKEVANGIFKKEPLKFNFFLKEPGNGKLNFEVMATNSYGNLLVFLNGKPIFNSKISEGQSLDLELKNLAQGFNELEIVPSSSGLKFWAPALYIIRNLKLFAEDKDFHNFTKQFSVKDYELRGFDRAELSFFIERAIRDEPLKIAVNKKEIFSQRVVARAMPYTIIFQSQEAGLKVGENLLEVFTGRNSEYKIENMLLRIFYFDSPERKIIPKEMTISSKRIEQIGKGEFDGIIEFDARVFLPGTLRIEFEKGKAEIFPKNGDNTLFFDPVFLVKGKNKLLLSTDGSMEIKNFKIKLKKKSKQ